MALRASESHATWCCSGTRGARSPLATFDEFEAALAEKQRADRAKREGKLDDYAAGLLTEPDSRMTLWDFMRLWFREDAAPHLAEATLTNYLQGRQQVDPADRRDVAAPCV